MKRATSKIGKGLTIIGDALYSYIEIKWTIIFVPFKFALTNVEGDVVAILRMVIKSHVKTDIGLGFCIQLVFVTKILCKFDAYEIQVLEDA